MSRMYSVPTTKKGSMYCKSSRLTMPETAGCTPPKSSTRVALMNTHTSSSPWKRNVSCPRYRKFMCTSLVKK